MTPVFKESSFPLDYRRAQVGQVMQALYRLRSIAVNGLAGMGKSNMVRFIVSHSQVWRHYLQERADDYAFVFIDCAGLVIDEEADLLAEVGLQLHREGLATRPAGGVSGIRQVVKEQVLDVRPALNLVLVFDYFDQAASWLGQAFHNYLFHLRNARPRGNLCYVFVTRRPLGHLHELQELFDDRCMVGPLGHQDALDLLQRDQGRLGCTFTAAQRARLIACTGGHPGLLKNAAELLCSGMVDLELPEAEVAEQMLQSAKVLHLCEELWQDLTPAEQKALSRIVRGAPLSEKIDRAAVAFLTQNGLLVEKAEGEALPLFSPLFAAFAQRASSAAGQVRITAVFPNQACIETPTGEECVTLSPKLFALLLALCEAQGQVLTIDELIDPVYGDEAAGVSNAALSQLIKRLRVTLDPIVQRLTDDPAYTCLETVRGVGFRLKL